MCLLALPCLLSFAVLRFEICIRPLLSTRLRCHVAALVLPAGDVKLADFGLARTGLFREPCSSGVRLDKNMVTPGYKAPEILLGSDQYDAKIDVWAAGCVFLQVRAQHSEQVWA